MPMYRGRWFQPGLSMRAFLSLYGTEELCVAALIASFTCGNGTGW
jgi:hypothetical protein